jgi:hypothetical protein
LNIDIQSIGAWTGSAHTPTAISYILDGADNIFKCLVVYYGFFLTNDFKYLPQIDTLSQNMGFRTPRLSEVSIRSTTYFVNRMIPLPSPAKNQC